ncbi:LacI family DNA-binding transcriptional regulator [Mycetocola zhujimingii]|uniref:LacI family DNA-binding transcriptional regulator n=1 Tax=Mycetocola zhujimingii TaxID=2079792 RepID=UPI001F2D2F6F|nr:LacI family DNA-binding transcriptional regulator [Mycetocola zhujimingii]
MVDTPLSDRPASTQPGAASMSDVARRAGVALGTVSNVLNRPSIVAPATRARVLAAIDELGFVRNNLARTLANGRADTLGFVIVDIGNSLFVDIARGAQAASAEAGMKLLLANSDVNFESQNDFLDWFDEARVGGVLLAPLDGPLEAAQRVRNHGRPVVTVNWPGNPGHSCGVTVDEEHGGYLAATHLLERGRTRLIFAGGPLSLHAVAERLSGARRAVAEWGSGTRLEVAETARLTIRTGREFGKEIAARKLSERPDAIVSAADALAAGCVQALVAERIRVPEDIAIIGYDNNHFAADSIIPISTVGQPGHEMGRIAAGLLLEEIAGGAHEHRTVTLAPELFERASTAGDARG